MKRIIATLCELFNQLKANIMSKQQRNSTTPESGTAEEVTATPESGTAEEVTTTPEGGTAEEVTATPEGGTAKEVTTTPESGYPTQAEWDTTSECCHSTSCE
jgi:hypothetical protein